MQSSIHTRLMPRLRRLYSPVLAESTAESLAARINQFCTDFPELAERSNQWSQQDVVLITYGDQVRSDQQSSLATLRQFLVERNLNAVINTVHILPFFPYSSDDGFSVIDFCQVDPELGSWQDVDRLGESFDLMFDLVLNHISAQSEWFQAYLRGEAPFVDFFIEVDPSTDLSSVTRPRSLPLLTEFETSRGPRHVWTTFSPDQVDLNYANPELLVRMMDVLLDYAAHGARIIRLDAIAYLWKQVGTSCIHLSQTHEVVKLMRDVLELASPATRILTETNVPHAENVSYFGDGDEAHMVYQFSLPPLLLDAMLNGDASAMNGWLRQLSTPPGGATYFNFTASHDGIGVRPLEGLVSPERFSKLVDAARDRGGRVSMKQNADGSESPYELNITYLDMLRDPQHEEDVAAHAQRFLATQAVMLALQGIPGIYFHSLVGTQNDLEGMELSGQARRINRRKFSLPELEEAPAPEQSLQRLVFEGYQRLLAIRVAQTAFHPAAEQTLVDTGRDEVLAFLRTAQDEQRMVFVATNFSRSSQDVVLPTDASVQWERELIHSLTLDGSRIKLPAQSTAWVLGRRSQ